jgi:hypothetical protein
MKINGLFLRTVDGGKCGAVFSDNEVYRYHLWRQWETGAGRCCFILLNPSTATEAKLDPTVLRCLSFAVHWGYNAVDILNLFALRSTNPKKLYGHGDPVGERNDEVIRRVAERAGQIIYAWGNHGELNGRAKAVRRLLDDMKPYALAITGEGHPKHPLYMKKTTKPFLLED